MNFTFEEMNLMSIYNTGTRQELIAELVEMRGHLQNDENELRNLTNSTIAKLEAISDGEFEEMELVPDFGEMDD